jgi:hypothetical protein
MEENGGVPVRWLTGGGPEVGEKLQGVEAVHKSYLAGARMAGRVGPHGDPGRQREGYRRRGGCGAQGRRWKGWRASRELGEAARGVGVDREEAGRAVHGCSERRQWSSTAAAVFGPGKEEESEWAGERGPQRS